jgi:hypothetical protein
LAQPAVLLEQPAAFKPLEDHPEELFRLDRLGEKIIGAGVQGLDRGFNGAVGAQQDHAQFGMGVQGLGEQLHAVHFRHAQVGDHHLGGLLAQGLQRRPAAVEHAGLDIVEMPAYEPGEATGEIRFVIDDHHLPAAGRGRDVSAHGCAPRCRLAAAAAR